MGWLRERKHLALLAALLLALVGYPALRGSATMRFLLDLGILALFASAFAVVFIHPIERMVAFLLAVPAVMGVCTGYMMPGVPGLAFASHAAALLFHVFVLTSVLRNVLAARHVSMDGIHAALCAYLLIGLAFGHAYSLLEIAAPGSFKADNLPSDDPARVHFILTYFSLTTLTTVGFGDVLPMHETARGLAVIEAMIGQLFLAVLVADLIGKRLANPKDEG